MAQSTGNPNGFSLSYTSICQHWLGTGNLNFLLLSLCRFLSSVSVESNYFNSSCTRARGTHILHLILKNVSQCPISWNATWSIKTPYLIISLTSLIFTSHHFFSSVGSCLTNFVCLGKQVMFRIRILSKSNFRWPLSRYLHLFRMLSTKPKFAVHTVDRNWSFRPNHPHNLSKIWSWIHLLTMDSMM